MTLTRGDSGSKHRGEGPGNSPDIQQRPVDVEVPDQSAGTATRLKGLAPTPPQRGARSRAE